MANIQILDPMERTGIRGNGDVFGLQKSSSKRLNNVSNEAIHSPRVSRSPWRTRVLVKAEDATPPSKRVGARKSPGRGRKLDLSAAKPKEASYRVNSGTQKGLPYRIKPLEEEATSSGTTIVNPRPIIKKNTSNRSWRQKREERMQRQQSEETPAVDQTAWQAKLAAFQKNERSSSATKQAQSKGTRLLRQSSEKTSSSEKTNPSVSRVASLKNLFSSPRTDPSPSPRHGSFSKINAKINTLKSMLGSHSGHKPSITRTPSGSRQQMRVKVKVKPNRPVTPQKDPVRERAATKLQACWRRYSQRKRYLTMVKYQRKINKLQGKLANVISKKQKELEEIAKVVQDYKASADAKAKRRRDALALRMKQELGTEKIIEELKKDNEQIQTKNDVLIKNSRNLRINNLRLEKSSESSKDYFDQLELHHSRCVEDNEKLTKVADNYQKKVSELQENLDTRSRYYNAEHRIRALYRKAIQKVISACEKTDDESLLLHLYELQDKIDHLEKKWKEPEPLSPRSAAVKKKYQLSMQANANCE